MEAKGYFRIGIAGITHESNTFYGRPTVLQDFRNGHLHFGDSIISEYQGAFHEIGGIIETLDNDQVEIVPLLYAEATPGGAISAKTADWLVGTLLKELDRSDPLDGLMVVPHGAAVSENELDFDGYWLQLVRKKLGPEIPIIGTLDPHANLSQRMVKATDALIAYTTNPHIDQRETGIKAARLMRDTLEGTCDPVQVAVQSPLAISIEQQNTSEEPCLSLFKQARKSMTSNGLLSISILLGFPYADTVDMGTALIAVAHRDASLARTSLYKLEKYLIDHHEQFDGDKIDVETAMKGLNSAPKPVLLLDMGDNVGGGSPGDGTVLLEALERLPAICSFICICDPEAVSKIRNLPVQEWFNLSIGGKSDSLHGSPVRVEATLLSVVDGLFSETEPRHGGQIHFNMGPTAIIKTRNDTTIMLTTLRTPPFSLQQLLQYGLRPDDFDCIVAKGVQAPLAAYAPVCKRIIRVNTPGITHADIRAFTYKNRRRPLYPFESITR